MRVFICEELINTLESNINKIKKIQSKVDFDNYEAYFIYTFALFESALCEAMRHILSAFPEKINGEKQLLIFAKDICSNELSPYEYSEILVENEIKKVSKGSASKILAEAEKVCAIQLKYDDKRLESISSIRNNITHENSPSRQVYKYKESIHKKEIEIIDNYKNNISYLLGILIEFSLKINEKYSKYTKYKMLRDFWNTLFFTPLLKFEDCVLIRESAVGDSTRKVVGFNFDYVEKVANSISSGEKFFLSILFQQYSQSLNEKIFKFSDIPMLVSISDKKNIYIFLRVMTLYPYLFNGMDMAEDIIEQPV